SKIYMLVTTYMLFARSKYPWHDTICQILICYSDINVKCSDMGYPRFHVVLLSHKEGTNIGKYIDYLKYIYIYIYIYISVKELFAQKLEYKEWENIIGYIHMRILIFDYIMRMV
ncbi:hypothetical protein ACJX0J_011941, partial [Zea mays]